MNGNEFIFGRRPVLEALQAQKRSLHKLWIAEGSHGMEEAVHLAREHGVPLEFVRKSRLDQMTSAHHQGIVAQASAVKFQDLNDFLHSLPHLQVAAATADRTGEAKPIVLVALDEIQDPHNVGAILRSAGFFGVAAALVPKWRSAPVGETASRVSSGAIEHVPLIRITNLAQSILDLKEAGFEVIGADMEGEPIDRYTPGKRCVLVLGSEGSGLRRLVRERCDKLIAIPGAGKVESLNVASTAAIFLYEFCRRR